MGAFDGQQASGDTGEVEEEQVAVHPVVHVDIGVEVGGSQEDEQQD